MKYIKPINIGVVVGILLVSVVGYYIVQQWFVDQNNIVIHKVPSDSKLYINDKLIKGDRTSLPNGKHRVRMEKEGFTTYIDEVFIDDFAQYIAVALSPQSEEAIEWAKRNESQYLQLEEFVGKQEMENGRRFAEQNPIVMELPIDNYTYSIGYTIDPSDKSGNSIILTVDTTDGYRNAAVEKISKLGYNPAEFKIVFKNHTSPFGGQ